MPLSNYIILIKFHRFDSFLDICNTSLLLARLLSILSRGLAKVRLEALRKVARRRESHHIHYLRYGKLVLLYQHRGFLHSHLLDEIHRRHAKMLLQLAIELLGTDVELLALIIHT